MDETVKMCIDYRALNQQTRPEKYPLPRIDDLLDQLVNTSCLSSIYLYTGYHQMQSTHGMGTKQLFYPVTVCLSFLCCHLALQMPPLHFVNK